ncbi:hypothetical protein J0S82_011983 [Galemys pyrenaicus]|uniref:Uncharacterized protein n=1 Tax=Galemys pyrenaicus TaxID=202257 RepID=A0A8J5ZTG5_GALPY|nr:hypothetical protein J0S82_011983 [Galemys pyrenaicus]
MAGLSRVGQKEKSALKERGWDSPISSPKHVTGDWNVSPDERDTEHEFYLLENDPLKRSLKSSSESLEGTSESHVGDIAQDPVMPPVQRRKLEPLPKKHRYLRKVVRTKRMRMRKRKKKMETHSPPAIPVPLVPPQSEDDEVVDPKPTLFTAQEDDPDLPTEVRVQSHQDVGACVKQQECQIQSCEPSVSQDPETSSPTATSLASPPLCFGRFLSYVCQTLSWCRKQKPPKREDTKQIEGGGYAKALSPGLLRGICKNREQPHHSL